MTISKKLRDKVIASAFEAQVSLLFRNLVDNVGDAGEDGNLRVHALSAFRRGFDNAVAARASVEKMFEEEVK